MADRRGKKTRRLAKARQKARGARIVRHKLVGGRTGGLAHHQRKNFKRGKGLAGTKQRYEVICVWPNKYPDFSIYAVRKAK